MLVAPAMVVRIRRGARTWPTTVLVTSSTRRDVAGTATRKFPKAFVMLFLRSTAAPVLCLKTCTVTLPTGTLLAFLTVPERETPFARVIVPRFFVPATATGLSTAVRSVVVGGVGGKKRIS